MKAFRSWWSVLPASALVLGACGKKEKEGAPPAAPGEVVPAAPGTQAEAAVPATPALTPGERAAMLGIVGQLAADTESVVAIYDGKEIVNRLRGLKTWEFIREVTEEMEGTDPEEEMAEGAEAAGKFLGEEIFIATGKGTAPQFGNLVKIGDRMNYFQMRMMVKSFADGVESGDISGVGETDPEAMMEMAKELGKDIPLIESAAMPPVLIGIKAADQETLDMARQQLASSIDMIWPEPTGKPAARRRRPKVSKFAWMSAGRT